MPTPDFSKIWASSSPLPDYTFTDEEYVTGWDFVGSAPPTKNEFDAWFRLVDQKLNWLYGQLQDTASKLYPIGSVYISFNSADPSTLFGGTWVRLKDTFLLANGDSYAPNTTGGSPTKTIGVSNMPSHNHSVSSSGNHTHSATTSASGSHSHTKGDMNITGTYDFAYDYDGVSYRGKFCSGAFVEGSSWTDTKDYLTWTNSEANHWQKMEFDASKTWTGSTSTAPNHTHTLNITSSGSHTHTTNKTGGGTPLNIMPPYTTVYAWRRTA